MKCVIEYTIGGDDIDEEFDFKCAMHSKEMYAFIHDLYNEVRSEWKHGSDITKEAFVDRMYCELSDILQRLNLE